MMEKRSFSECVLIDDACEMKRIPADQKRIAKIISDTQALVKAETARRRSTQKETPAIQDADVPAQDSCVLYPPHPLRTVAFHKCVSSFNDILRGCVRGVLQVIVQSQLEELVGTCRASVRAYIAGLAAPLLPAPCGVTKLIQAGTPTPVWRTATMGLINQKLVGVAKPVSFDEVDYSLFDLVKKNGSRNDYLIDDPASGFQITRAQLQTLLGTNWLDDQILNYYCTLVAMAACEKFNAASSKTPPVIFLNSFFYKKVLSDKAGARRFLRSKNLIEAKLVLIVLHVNDNHWTCCIVNNSARSIVYYDSLGSAGQREMKAIAEIMDDDVKSKIEQGTAKKSLYVPFRQYQRLSPGNSVPQQVGGCDCGVFASQFLLHVAMGLPFCFTQSDITRLRNIMLLELLAKRLLVRYHF